MRQSDAENAVKDASSVRMPIYLLLDVSPSMVLLLKQLQSGLERLLDEIKSEPIIASLAQLAIVTFSSDVRVDLGLTDLYEVTAIPRLEVRVGSTRYGPAFYKVGELIQQDVSDLKARNLRVHRPTVFVVTDGLPTDPEAEWEAGLAWMKHARPNVFAVGIGDVDPRILGRVATRPSFAILTEAGSGTHSFATSLVQLFKSFLASSTGSVAEGTGQAALRLPIGLASIPDFVKPDSG